VLILDNPFWQFSLYVYARPAVAPECLDLQQRFDVDVNVVLFCAWIGSARRVALNDDDLEAISSCVTAWHETVVRSLRAARQGMKPMPAMEDLSVRPPRADIAKLELRAEQVEQAMLFELSPQLRGAAMASAAEAIHHNVALYLRSKTPPGSATPQASRLTAEAAAYQPG
jgi:uncharacterized protein (TIGR02444 family)